MSPRVALRHISLQCDDLSLLGAKQTSRLVCPGEFMSSRPSTTLADLFKLHVRTYPFVAVRASLRRHSSDESDDGVTDGRQAWLRRRSVDSFFPISLF